MRRVERERGRGELEDEGRWELIGGLGRTGEATGTLLMTLRKLGNYG